MAERKFDYDWLVVGSGFGGSVSGAAPGREGLQGRRAGTRAALPRRGFRQEHRGICASTSGRRISGCAAIFRLTPFKDVFIASGSGVGGGSLVYANTLYRAAPEFFTHPQWAGLEDWAAALEPHYATAERMLGVQTGTVRQRQPEAAEGGRRRVWR